MFGRILAIISVLLLTCSAQETTPAETPQPVSSRSILVEPGIGLEVLDWGGTGRPLMLLAGLGSDAHEFDGFAPKLAAHYHVYAMTRRGFGTSDTPAVPYLADRLGDDVLAVMNTLKLQRPVLVGHSYAGEELSSIGTRFPDRVAGLVYLEAGYSYALYDKKLGAVDVDTAVVLRAMQTMTTSPVPDEQHVAVKELLSALPRYSQELQVLEQQMQSAPQLTPQQVEELRRQAGTRENKSTAAVLLGSERFSGVRCPVLAIFAIPHDQGIPAGPARDAAEAVDIRESTAQADAFQAANPQATVIRIARANHNIFQSNEAEVLSAIQHFSAGLPEH